METKKILGIIFGALAVLIFGFVLTWGIINFNKVKDGMSGTGLYTKEDLNNSYEDGYNTALMDKAEYEALISGYRDTITTQTDQISKLNSQITTLNNSNKDYKNQIQSLNNTISVNVETINNLQSLIDKNDITIAELETEISNNVKRINVLEKEISALQNENGNMRVEIQNKQNQVSSLNNQVNSLQNLVNQLNATNETNLATISTLNNQIQSLNAQIIDLKIQINNNNNNVYDLNNQISDLQKSIAYYEQYISNLETDSQVVATFEFDGSVYNVQILNKGSFVSVVNPTSTDFMIFNGWMVNNEIVDLNSYPIDKNTKFIANVTYKYKVEFSVDNEIISTQVVEKNNLVSIPTSPIKDGYSFDGWTVDGVNIINLSSYNITKDTSFIALFTKTYNVTFMYEDTTLSSQTIRNGDFAQNVNVENSTYKTFNGWLVNGTSVDINTYKIIADTVFVADISYKYNVTFMLEDEICNSQIVTANSYVTIPEIPVKKGYKFLGWSINGSDIIDLSVNPITSNTIFVAVMQEVDGGLYTLDTNELIYTWDELISNNIISVSGQSIESSDTEKLSGLLKINSNITKIGLKAFQGCVNLTGIEIPVGVTSIPAGYQFDGCKNLNYVNYLGTLYDWLTKINNGSSSFLCHIPSYNSRSLYIQGVKLEGKVVVPEGITTLRAHAFACIDDITEIVLSSSVTTLDFACFRDMQGLKNIVWNESVVSIGDYCFDCSAIETIILPSCVQSIGEYAFSGCEMLSSVTIGSGVMTIKQYAFAGCSNLSTMIFEVTNGWKRGIYSISSDIVADSSEIIKYLTIDYKDWNYSRS